MNSSPNEPVEFRFGRPTDIKPPVGYKIVRSFDTDTSSLLVKLINEKTTKMVSRVVIPCKYKDKHTLPQLQKEVESAEQHLSIIATLITDPPLSGGQSLNAEDIQKYKGIIAVEKNRLSDLSKEWYKLPFAAIKKEYPEAKAIIENWDVHFECSSVAIRQAENDLRLINTPPTRELIEQYIDNYKINRSLCQAYLAAFTTFLTANARNSYFYCSLMRAEAEKQIGGLELKDDIRDIVESVKYGVSALPLEPEDKSFLDNLLWLSGRIFKLLHECAREGMLDKSKKDFIAVKNDHRYNW